MNTPPRTAKLYPYLLALALLQPLHSSLALTAPTLEAVSSGGSGPASINFTITSADAGTISKVEFFNGVTKIGESTTAPFSFTWPNVPNDDYALSALAYTKYVTSTSTFTVSSNPSALYVAPATVNIEVLPDLGGNISKVEFFNGATKLGEDASFPYIYTWENVGEGTYSVTALANLQIRSNSVPLSINSTTVVVNPPTGGGGGGSNSTSASTYGGQTTSGVVTSAPSGGTPQISAAVGFKAITTDNLILRTAPSGTKIKALPKGTTVTVTNTTTLTGKSWVAVTLADGSNGWVFDQYLSSNTTATASKPIPSVGTQGKRTAYVTSPQLNLRVTPSGTVIEAINKNVLVSIENTANLNNGTWVTVTLANGKSGWMLGKYLKEVVKTGTTTASTQAQTTTSTSTPTGGISVSAYGLNVRKTPEGEVLGEVVRGAQGTILETSTANWIKVQFTNGLTGYVNKKYVIVK